MDKEKLKIYTGLLEKLNVREITYTEFYLELKKMNLPVPEDTVKEIETYTVCRKKIKNTKLSEIMKMDYKETVKYIKDYIDKGMSSETFISEITDWYDRGMLTGRDLEYIKSALTDVTEKNN